jgi:hydrogenase maturation protein HypF
MKERAAKIIHIKGLVQGVGFRPFVYRYAVLNNISGWVINGNDGVHIHAEGRRDDLDLFTKQLSSKAPVAAKISDIITHTAPFLNLHEFVIQKSSDHSDRITDISPDIAVCDDCLTDMKSQENRINYPFINCTNCGPRFTIIKGLPYDRAKTTMEPFVMCPVCKKEYGDVNDRRFHAQPVACNDCGPRYELIENGQSVTVFDDILDKSALLIGSGMIIAVKGMGGFHLACNASDEAAVNRLRQRKYREGKPFAVMFRDVESCKNFMEISLVEEENLLSWRKPIILLKNKKEGQRLAPGVSNGFNTTGVMMPYMPLHYLLFEKLSVPAIVFTSGNISDEPVIIDNDEAMARLENVADAFLLYNREIYNRTDDSVMMVTNNEPRLIRRSRGFAPSPVNLSLNVDGIFAAGAELVNCFCVGKDDKALMSQHIGDLKNLETLSFYKESLERYIDIFRVKPRLVAYDLHPDYLSTVFAREFAEIYNLPMIGVQHHHAHIASCMAEHGLDEKVIGIVMDGVGFGSDGNIWGFEVLACDLKGFERNTHLKYVQQPGGDMANREPWRMALSYIRQYIGINAELPALPFLKQISKDKIQVVLAALENNINTPLTSSAGRLFDAVAAMTGICTFSDFHAEAPMRLENIIDHTEKGSYDFILEGTINPQPLIENIISDIKKGTDPGIISARFHNGIVDLIIKLASLYCEQEDTDNVVLSGGSFQNRFILTETEKRLKDLNFNVYTQSHFPSNDGGIALGQLVIAARQRDLE